jgi:septum formation protein
MSDPADLHPLWLGATPLVLASGSATRFKLLTDAGLPVQVVRPAIDERAVEAPLAERGTSPEHIAAVLAQAKALAVAKKLLGRHVLGADQVLACDGVQLHKPKDRAAAKEQIAFLAGRSHQLYSAVTIAHNHQLVASFVGTAKLTMRSLSADDRPLSRFSRSDSSGERWRLSA